jgi:6-phosphogluconolactonase
VRACLPKGKIASQNYKFRVSKCSCQRQQQFRFAVCSRAVSQHQPSLSLAVGLVNKASHRRLHSALEKWCAGIHPYEFIAHRQDFTRWVGRAKRCKLATAWSFLHQCGATGWKTLKQLDWNTNQTYSARMQVEEKTFVPWRRFTQVFHAFHEAAIKRMKAIIRFVTCAVVIAVLGCGDPLPKPSANVALLYLVGQGSNAVEGFHIQASGEILSTAVPSFATNPRPVAIALHPSTNFLYVANLTSNTVSGFSLDHTSGFLTPVGTALTPISTGPSPIALSVNPGGQFLYVLNQGDATISIYAIDPVRGILTSTGPAFSTGLTNPQGMLISPGSFLYIIAGTAGSTTANAISVFSIGSDGALTPAAGGFTAAANSTLSGMTTDPKGQFMYVADSANNNVHSLSIDASGALSEVAGSPFAAGTQPVAVAVNGAGTFVYVSNSGSNNVSAYTANSGVLTEDAGSPFPTQGTGTVVATQPGFLLVDATNTFLFVANQGGRSIASFGINAADGTLVPVSTSPFGQLVTPIWMVSTK